jgi:hypothetical protein
VPSCAQTQQKIAVAADSICQADATNGDRDRKRSTIRLARCRFRAAESWAECVAWPPTDRPFLCALCTMRSVLLVPAAWGAVGAAFDPGSIRVVGDRVVIMCRTASVRR